MTNQAQAVDQQKGEVPDPDHPALAENPRLTNRYYHLIRVLKGGLQKAVAQLDLSPESRILDYGCSSMRHRGMFPADAEYIGADLEGNDLADVFLGDDGCVPLEDNSFDVVFSTQVLEHVADPQLYLRECQRLLKPGGQLILSTHGIYVFHPCPTDYWRWTYPGLRKIVEDAGFEVTSLRGLSGGLPTALQLLQDVSRQKLPRLLRPLFFVFIQGAMAITDRMYSEEGRIKNATFLLITANARPASRSQQTSDAADGEDAAT